MGRIFYIMGKSSSGKDTIFEELLKKRELGLQKVVLYTTRPIRFGEADGVQYHFVDEEKLLQLTEAGKVVELRAYDTVCGVWKYFTVDDGQIDLKKNNYLAIGTLKSYEKIRLYYGAENVVPVYVEVEDGLRLERALSREKQQEKPNYEEMCRRFLADTEDFSERNILRAKINRRFYNNGEISQCIKEISEYIEERSVIPSAPTGA